MNQMINFKVLPGEDVNQYISRLAEQRTILGLTWDEIADHANKNFGTCLSDDAVRCRSRRKLHANIRAGHNNTLPNTTFLDECADDRAETPSVTESMIAALKKERYKLADERAQVNAMYRRMAREETFKEIAEIAAKTINSSFKLNFPSYIPEKATDKEAILQISDWHYGIDETSVWNKYNPEVAKERVERLTTETIKYCKLNNVNKLHVVDLGDMIAGKIHTPIRINSRFDIVTQVIQVTEIIAEMLNEFSKYFRVEYYSTLDNHSRLENNLKESMEPESMVRVIKWNLKPRLSGNPNITINDNEFGDDIVTFQTLGHSVVGVHGNKDKPTNVIKNMTLHTHRHYDLVLTAHLHHFSAEESNETLNIANGSLMGTDSYALQLRLNSFPSQNLMIVTPDNVAECIYKINLK